MHMNVKPIPTLDPRINEIRALTAQIVNRDILPNEGKLWVEWRDGRTDDERRNAQSCGSRSRRRSSRWASGRHTFHRSTVTPAWVS